MDKLKRAHICTAYDINAFFQKHFDISYNAAVEKMGPYHPRSDGHFIRIYKGEQMVYETDEQREAIDAFLTAHGITEVIVAGW